MPTPARSDDLVALDDACWLAAGVNPDGDLSKVSDECDAIYMRVKTGDGPPYVTPRKIWPAAIAAVESGELPAFVHRGERKHPRLRGLGKIEGYDVERFVDSGQTRVDRTEFAVWLWRAHGIKSALLPDPDQRPGKRKGVAPDAELNARSRRTLLAIIAALAKHGSIDLKKPLAGGGLAEALATAIEVDFGRVLSPRRIADLLAEARDLPHEDEI